VKQLTCKTIKSELPSDAAAQENDGGCKVDRLLERMAVFSDEGPPPSMKESFAWSGGTSSVTLDFGYVGRLRADRLSLC
jgi:hypothetical protein